MSNSLRAAFSFVAITGVLVCRVAEGAPAATSAYFTDGQRSYVQDATSDSIGSVNMITCIMSSMRPDALVNQGPYVALVDNKKCESSKSSSTDGTGQAPEYIHAVVNSTRASNNDPMLVSAWLSFNDHGEALKIFVHITATEAPTAGNPYGAFRIDYCGRPDGTQDCMINGFMQGGSGELSYYESNAGDEEGHIALKLTSVGTTSGSGKIESENFNEQGASEYAFAFNQNNFLRADSQSPSQCFSRDATDEGTGISVWRYGLYDADTGARIDRNSGFPIQYTSGDVTYQGYVGYFGLSSSPDAPAVTDGTTVQKVSYENKSAVTAEYTASTRGGRLTRYTKKTRMLASIDHVHFNTFIGDNAAFGLPHPNSNYEMYWDEADTNFKAVGEQQCSPDGCHQTTFDSEIALDASLWSSGNLGGVQGWSQSLGGDLFINLSGSFAGSSNTTVVYHSQDLVYPGETVPPLYCASNCPTAASMQAYFQAQSHEPSDSPYANANVFHPLSEDELVRYQMTDGVLVEAVSGQAVVDVERHDNAGSYGNGVMSGRLFTTLANADCTRPEDQIAQYCDYQVNNSADVYYQWQTGPNNFNQFAALKDSSGEYVQFDAPLNVNFTVPDEPAFGDYRNKSLVLQYGGYGDLWGIPGVCVSPSTNEQVSCGEGTRFVPQFAIPFDATRGVVSEDSSGGAPKTYLVKWLEREIRFAVKDLTVCSSASLTTPTNVQLPMATALKNPSDASSDVYVGVEPVVTDAPRVIQGEVKY